MSYSRYKKFTSNGTVRLVPFIKIPKKSSDQYETYIQGSTRLDRLSYKYYNDCNYDWLILQANADIASLEFLIPDGTELRIPYPLDTTLTQYINDVDTYETLYGTE